MVEDHFYLYFIRKGSNLTTPSYDRTLPTLYHLERRIKELEKRGHKTFWTKNHVLKKYFY